MSYIGNSPGVASQRVTTTLTATAGQTQFTTQSGYVLGYVDVYLNGAKLVNGSDFEAITGTYITLFAGAAVGDVIELVSYVPRGLSDGYTKAEADAKFLDVGGDTATGAINLGANGLVVGTDQLVTSGGKVGVGTASPPETLTVVGNIKAGYEPATGLVLGLTNFVPNNNVNGYILWGNDSVFGGVNGDLIYIPRSSAAASHRFYTGTGGLASEKVRITNTGQLGLGTTSFQNHSPAGSLSFPQGASLQTGSFARAWNPAQQIGQGSAAGLYGMAHTYLAYYDAGWKSLGGGTASAITIDEGIFSFSNSNGVGATNSALTWTTRMLITTGGNVGIGTVTPDDKLEVWGNLRLDGPSGTNREIYFRNQGSGDGAAIKSDKALTFYAGSGSGSPTRYMTLLEGGNLGIGTVSPTAKLHINTGTNGTAFIAHASSSSISEVNIGVGVLTAGRPFVGTNTNTNPMEIGTRASADLIFVSNSAERMRIDPNGNVGVGTTTPSSSRLVVALDSYPSTGGELATFRSGTTSPTTERYIQLVQSYTGGAFDSPMLVFRSNANSSNQQAYGTVRGTADGFLVFGTASATDSGISAVTSKMWISSTGHVGVGTASPTEKLHVYGTSTATTDQGPRINLQYSGTAGNAESLVRFLDFRGVANAAIGNVLLDDGVNTAAADLVFKTAIGGGLYERMRIKSNGRVAIGYSSTWNDSGPYLQVRDGIVIGSTASPALFTSIKSSNGYDLTLTANANPANLGVDANIIFSSGNSGGGGPAELMRIVSNGNVGIGTNNPGAKLHTLGSSYSAPSSANNHVRFEGGGGNGVAIGTLDVNSVYASWIQSGYVPSFSTATYNLCINPLGGNVGIGTTSPVSTAKLDVNGSIKSSRTVYNWFQWGGNPSGAYLHIKTSLWSGGGGSNSQPTMSLFHVKGYNYDGHTIDAMIGFHNWSGSQYSLRVTNSGSWTGSHGTYTSADGYVVLVIHTGASYPGISIDYHQSFPYGWQNVSVTAYSSSTSGSAGVY